VLLLAQVPNVLGADYIQQNTTVIYQVQETVNQTISWSNLDFTEFYPYHIKNDSRVNITIVDTTHPIAIDIAIGNLSRIDISDNEAENALAIGYWTLPNNFGFFANTSWDDVKDEFDDLEISSSSFQQNLKDEYLGRSIDVVVIGLDDGFQVTTLVYEKTGGLLLYARSSFTGYLLQLKIESINGDNLYFTNITNESVESDFTNTTTESVESDITTESAHISFVFPLVVIAISMFSKFKWKRKH
jgi:hypothetical protein